MSPRFIVRIVSAIISTPCVVVIYLNIEKWAEANGYDSFLVDWTRHADGTAEPEPVMSILTSGPMLYGAIAISSLTLGLWIDWVARRFERSKPSKKSTLKSIGYECKSLGRDIGAELGTIDPRIYRYLPQLHSLSLKMRKAKLPTTAICPNDSEYMGLYVSYLRFVGQLLVDGHNNEASGTAQSIINEMIQLADRKGLDPDHH